LSDETITSAISYFRISFRDPQNNHGHHIFRPKACEHYLLFSGFCSTYTLVNSIPNPTLTMLMTSKIMDAVGDGFGRIIKLAQSVNL